MMFMLSAQIAMPLFVLGIFFVFITVYKLIQRKKKRRSPFTDTALLRLPGHSLNKQIEELTVDIDLKIFLIFITAMVFTQMIVFMAAQKGIAPSPLNYPLHYGVMVIVIGVVLYKIVKALNSRGKLRLGYEGELVTAQELHKLMPEGNYVFHDFPAGNFNIDHVVVGPAGVFAIETKTRSKRTLGDNTKEAKATYKGNEIEFPGFSDKKYLDQARRQAKWLANWLKSAIGEPVDVFPVISLPGWYVKREIGFDGTFVINPKQLKGIVRSKTSQCLDNKKISQINHQLEAKCCDIEIISKQYDKR
jgi:Nuclease-related domain